MPSRRPPNFLIISFLLSLLSACSSSIELKGFDPVAWQRDKYGCQDIRSSYAETIKEATDQLLERSQNEIEEIFGPPDEHELDKRRQKFFYYFLQPGPQCSQPTRNPIQLQIRFNAVGLSSEVFLMNFD